MACHTVCVVEVCKVDARLGRAELAALRCAKGITCLALEAFASGDARVVRSGADQAAFGIYEALVLQEEFGGRSRPRMGPLQIQR